MDTMINLEKLIRNWREAPLDEVAIRCAALSQYQIMHGLPPEIAAERNEMLKIMQPAAGHA